MTEPTQPEGGQEQVNQELPTPKFTETSAGSATSSVDMDALAEKVAGRLRPDFEKMAQSTKDKRIAEIQKRLGIGELAELEEMGAQIPDNVKLEYRFRQLEKQRSPEGSAQAPTSQGSGATLTAQDVTEVVQQYKLDANEPDVLEALRGTYRNRDHFEASLAKLAMARLNRTQPSPAESPTLQPARAGGPSEKSASQLEADYQKEAAAIMQSTTGNERIRAIAALKTKYRGLGLDKN